MRGITSLIRTNKVYRFERRSVAITCQVTSPSTISKKTTPRKSTSKMTTLVSFDVDGTLIHSVGEKANQLHKEAFSTCFKEIYGIDTTIDVVKHHGSTDPLIILKVLEYHGIPKEKSMERLSDLQQSMINYFHQHEANAGLGLEILPGVRNILEILKERGDVATCLVTGNLQPIGWGKMSALGIKELFTPPQFGGFGSDFCSGNTEESWKDRAELVGIAAKRAEELVSGPLVGRFHIGDAPMDLLAAKAAGAIPIGVTTGIYDRKCLEECGADVVVLDGLSDVGKVLEILGLGKEA